MSDPVDPIDDPAIRQRMVEQILRDVSPIRLESCQVLVLADNSEAARLVREYELVDKFREVGLVVHFKDPDAVIYLEERPRVQREYLLKMIESISARMVIADPPKVKGPAPTTRNKREQTQLQRQNMETARSRVPNKTPPRPRPRMSARKR